MDNVNVSTSTLQKIGFSDKEARVYLGLLQVGQGSAAVVARHAGVKRPTTYLILEDLRKRGLVLKMPGSNKQMFTAQSPAEVLGEARKNLAEAEQILPKLMRVYDQSTPQVRTLQFEGIEGVRQALWYKIKDLKDTTTRVFFGSADNASQELIELSHEWNASLAKQGTLIRSIAPDSPTLKKFRENDKLYGFKPFILPLTLYTSQTSIEITDTFVRIIMLKEQQALIIENPMVAKALQEIFDLVWKGG